MGWVISEPTQNEPSLRQNLTRDDLVDVVDQEVEELVRVLLHVVVELDWKNIFRTTNRWERKIFWDISPAEQKNLNSCSVST